MAASEAASTSAKPPPHGLLAAAKRWGDVVALIVATVLYCFWPNGSAADSKWRGGYDDIMLLVVAGFLARRVFNRRPDLLISPAAVFRAIKRKFWSNR